jgi:hypothetical protein
MSIEIPKEFLSFVEESESSDKVPREITKLEEQGMIILRKCIWGAKGENYTEPVLKETMKIRHRLYDEGVHIARMLDYRIGVPHNINDGWEGTHTFLYLLEDLAPGADLEWATYDIASVPHMAKASTLFTLRQLANEPQAVFDKFFSDCKKIYFSLNTIDLDRKRLNNLFYAPGKITFIDQNAHLSPPRMTEKQFVEWMGKDIIERSFWNINSDLERTRNKIKIAFSHG